MKLTKLFFLAIFCLTLFTCSEDDDSGNDVQPPITITPTITAQVDAILALPPDPMGNPVDITDLVSFGQPAGVSTADYTAELRIGDTFAVEQPTGLQAGDVFVYENVVFEDPAFDDIAENFVDFIDCVDEFGDPDPNCDNADFYLEFNIAAIDAEEADFEEKFDIFCYIRRGIDEFGPYVIDPKLRIKGRNTTGN